MATKKVTQLATATSADAADLVMIVDVSDPAMSPEGTNKQITKSNLGIGGLLTQVATVVNNAAVLTMKYDDDPITLVAAAGAGKIIVPVNFTIVAVGAGGPEGSSEDLRFGWSASVSTTTDYTNSIRDYMNGISSGIHTSILSPLNTSFATSLPFTAANRPFQAWCTGDFDGGWSMTIYTTYYTITE
tara:strand:- start:622 stop:1182 length:561 start_codon:yes stop_codon:yes gene_type:complete